jgi:hypothetical protein
MCKQMHDFLKSLPNFIRNFTCINYPIYLYSSIPSTFLLEKTPTTPLIILAEQQTLGKC